MSITMRQVQLPSAGMLKASQSQSQFESFHLVRFFEAKSRFLTPRVHLGEELSGSRQLGPHPFPGEPTRQRCLVAPIPKKETEIMLNTIKLGAIALLLVVTTAGIAQHAPTQKPGKPACCAKGSCCKDKKCKKCAKCKMCKSGKCDAKNGSCCAKGGCCAK